METATKLDYESAAIEDLPQLWDGFAKLVREGLGISGFGVQIMDLPPNYTTASHDESESGQEELYVALQGSGAVVVRGGADHGLLIDPARVVAVGPHVERTLSSGPHGLRVMCVGATPGTGYTPPNWTTVDA
jgi:hypothetical protein